MYDLGPNGHGSASAVAANGARAGRSTQEFLRLAIGAFPSAELCNMALVPIRDIGTQKLLIVTITGDKPCHFVGMEKTIHDKTLQALMKAMRMFMWVQMVSSYSVLSHNSSLKKKPKRKIIRSKEIFDQVTSIGAESR